MTEIDRMNRLKALEEKADLAYQAAFGKKSNLGDITASDDERMRRVENVLNDVGTSTPHNTAPTPTETPAAPVATPETPVEETVAPEPPQE